MAMIDVLLTENLVDEEFARRWTNAPYLVRNDTDRLLTEADLLDNGCVDTFLVWDEHNKIPVDCAAAGVWPALLGSFAVRLSNGTKIQCRSALQILKEAAAEFTPEISENITTVPAAEVRKAVRLFVSSS